MAHLEFRILLANDIQAAFALHDLAILTTLLDGCFNFHSVKFLFVSERYSSFCQIIRGHFDPHFVSGQDPDIMHTHLARDVGDDHVAVVELDAEHRVGQGLDNGTFFFDS